MNWNICSREIFSDFTINWNFFIFPTFSKLLFRPNEGGTFSKLRFRPNEGGNFLLKLDALKHLQKVKNFRQIEIFSNLPTYKKIRVKKSGFKLKRGGGLKKLGVKKVRVKKEGKKWG